MSGDAHLACLLLLYFLLEAQASDGCGSGWTGRVESLPDPVVVSTHHTLTPSTIAYVNKP